MTDHPRIPLLLIVSQGHSGSTVMDTMLDTHSAFVGLGEVLRYHRAVEREEDCTCGRKVTVCPFWQVVFAGVGKDKSALVHRHTLDALLDRKHFMEVKDGVLVPVDTRAYLDFNARFFRSILHVSGKRIICDSSKNSDRADLFMSDPRFDVTVVHLVRDGRAVSYSYMRKTHTQHFFRFAREWFMSNIKIMLLRRRHPDSRYIFVRYADFVDDPRATLERMLSPYGLSFEEEMLKYREHEHHQVGGNIRFRSQTQSNVKDDTVWQRELTLVDRALFALFFGWMNRVYGYPLLCTAQKKECDHTMDDMCADKGNDGTRNAIERQ